MRQHYTSRIISHEAGSIGENNNMGRSSPPGSPTRFPPTEVIMEKYIGRRREGHFRGLSEGTSPTVIETSPLSLEDRNTRADTVRHSNVQTRRSEQHNRMSYNYSGNHDIADIAISGKIGTSKRPSSNNRGMNNGSRHYTENQSTRRVGPPAASPDDEYRNSEYTKTMSRRTDILTWRMDPSQSLSDFELTVIGIDDKMATKKYFDDKKKMKKKQSKRKDKWMVEGLYLDMSQSDEDESDDDEGRHNSNIKDNRHLAFGPEHQSHNVQVHTSLSGSKSSNYPVVKKYHLHKVNLAVGMRSCDYFARLFQKKNDSISSHSIEIPISCLPAIPHMLDYVYNPDPTTPVCATTLTAIPLRYLGTLLGCRSLFESATRFLHEDLQPKTAIEYLQQAELYKQTKLAGVCTRICAESFDQLKITWFASLSPHLMKKILHSKYFTRSMDSLALSSKIASYCRCQAHKIIDRGTLLALTNEMIIPVICPEEALFFIQMMIRLGMDIMEDPNTTRDDQYLSSKERSLYERCINAAPTVVTGVIDSLTQCNGEVNRRASRQAQSACGDYARLPPQIKVDLLEYALASSV